jgi:hypothetical protein
MKTVDIPGGTATLREKPDVKVRHRRLVEAAAIEAAPVLAKLPGDEATREAMTETEVLALGVSRKEVHSLFELQDATIVALLASWSLPGELPDMDTIGDLDPELYDALSKASGGLGADITGETFEPPKPDSPGFAESPTVPSADSEPGSRADPEPASTDAPASISESTSTAVSSPA